MKNYLIIFSALLFSSCGYDGTNIEKYPSFTLKFSELPDEVKNVYLNQCGPYDHEILEENGHIINLDSINSEFYYKNTAIVGIRPGANIFTINGKSFYLKWNGNKEQPPFIFNKGQIYFLLARNIDEMNLNDLSELKKCIFKMYDIRN